MSERLMKVLLIEDDPMVQQVNKQFVERVSGFIVTGVASTGLEGMELLRKLEPDLVILDIFMPLQDGLETITQIRRQQLSVDVMVISAANDQSTIARMLQNGAVDYIIKPFKFERVKQALEQYRSMKGLLEKEGAVSQNELDRLLFGSETRSVSIPRVIPDPEATAEQLPKGLQGITLKQITLFLLDNPHPLSAEEVAEGVGIARVTARRYLDFLEKSGKVRLDLQYGIGRPVNKYVISQL
ncbi:response regulator [Paenibacillus radicis (ex Xue et al. 2023)]|uniref:Transcriptional regulatory protein n=1 Tax=Paenibacillus radicis (ex Xue et al. 2023) TaxID=2972489 RepID=A0ABT1YUD0_9BACL|nr:response regulator [Paenibacillus radicis (ex Xue et al. 2023)]MCR8636717.1 response regulator [Paenibacillus radicis (ex Xue et al. 2023)]